MFFAFDEVKNHNLDAVANAHLERRLNAIEIDDDLRHEYERTDRYWRTLYLRFELFKTQYDACMNRPRDFVVASATTAVAFVVVAGCSSVQLDSFATTPASKPAIVFSTDPSTTEMPDHNPSQSSAGTGTGTGSSSHAVVTTSGGSVEVSGRGSEIFVIATTTEPGWKFAVRHPDPGSLQASFTRAGARIDVDVMLAANGIQSTTRSVDTG